MELVSDEIKLKGEFEDLWMNFIVWVVLIDNINKNVHKEGGQFSVATLSSGLVSP